MSITEKSKKLINEILELKRVSSGKYVREFEKKFAKLVGTKEAVALSSGTDAVALALAVLYDFGAERNDEIIVPALSFVATGNAVLQAGFKPVFVDIEKETLNIDPKKIEQAITEKTRAIIAVHLMGKPADMESIRDIAKKYNLFVIEDAAEAHGTVYKGKNAGTMGDMAAFSLYVAHMISTIEGGIVTTNKPEFAEILRSLRSHGRACKCVQCVLNTNSGYCPKRFNNEYGSDIRFIFERIGFSKYSEILQKRRQNLTYLMSKFKKFKPLLLSINEGLDERIGPHAFPVIIQENNNFSRDDLVLYLEKKGIDSRSLFSSMPTQCPGFKFLGYSLGEFPNAEYIGRNGIHIGIHQDIEKEDLDYFIRITEEFLSKN